MKTIKQIIFLVIIYLANGCVTQFVPEVSENQEKLVIQGLITDQYASNTIKVTKSLPLGTKLQVKPVTGCQISISDDIGNKYSLSEKKPGIYSTDSLRFRGIVGRKYTLYIWYNDLTFISTPMEMKPVPAIDSLFYEKTRNESVNKSNMVQGCQVFLNTHDPLNTCKYFRWQYIETWKFIIPYNVPNNICWVSNYSDKITIKNASDLNESNVARLPVVYISTETDRLQYRYSLLVNQYSLNETEFNYWEKLQKVSQEVGGLYDATPMSIPNNIRCVENPDEKVLGFFSVSAVSSRRIFIKNDFSGFSDFYSYCPDDTADFPNQSIPNLNKWVWIIAYDSAGRPILTHNKECADCTARGSKTKPSFWIDE